MANLLTNFPKEQELLYRRAIQESGWSDVLSIKDTAYTLDNRRVLPNFKALHTTSNKDHGPFWKVFRKIKKEMENMNNE